MDKYLEWAIPFVRHKDVLRKEIVEIKQNEESLTVIKANSKEAYFPLGDNNFKDLLKKDLSKFDSVWLICNNSSKTISNILDSWKGLSQNDVFRIICINLTNGAKWMINPSIHTKIVPGDKLEKSLKSLKSNS